MGVAIPECLPHYTMPVCESAKVFATQLFSIFHCLLPVWDAELPSSICIRPNYPSFDPICYWLPVAPETSAMNYEDSSCDCAIGGGALKLFSTLEYSITRLAVMQ